MRSLRSAVLGAVVLIGLLDPARAAAQAGSTVTPDRLTYVVNKDLAGERWTITMNLASVDPPRLINVTGNVFRPGGGPPSFIWCQIRSDSSGSLGDPNSTFALRCYGTDACGSTATACAREDWRLIADRVEISASFFLPGGAGFKPASEAPKPFAISGAAAETPPAAPAQTGARGATLPPDATQFLVNKDIGATRWSISLNLVPSQPGEDPLDSETLIDRLNRGRIDNRILSVTGNVFPPGGGEPQFVFCQELADSQGDLGNPSSEFLFSCVGTDACDRTPEECAREEWRDIPDGERLPLPASFFLPDGGLPAPPLSDSDLIVIGRTSYPPAIVVGNYDGVSSLGVPAGACAVGQSCTASVGTCAQVTGRLVETEAGCGCQVDEVPPECILCGGSSSCGGECEYAAGGGTARGRCLPFSSTSSDCACFATDPENPATIGICGGSLNATCPENRCCADDPRDGCDPARGDEECAGVCVASGGCDPTDSSCGLCLDQRGANGGQCGGGVLEPSQDCCADTGFCESCFCESGATCVTDGANDRCCPTSAPLYCPINNLCIPDGGDCCPNGKYCGVGYECAQDDQTCCPTAQPWFCERNSICVPEGAVCCTGTTFCPGGQFCANDGSCIPAGQVACGRDGFYCGPGQICVPVGDGFRCETPTDECPNGLFCDDGYVCTTNPDGCCLADLPTVCGDSCFAAGASCCDNGTVCGAGFTCTSVEDYCCPVDTPYLCPGTDVCAPDPRQCCGDGRYCTEAGFVCTIDPDYCCPSDTPVLCPNRRDCAADLSLCDGVALGQVSKVMREPEVPAGANRASPALTDGTAMRPSRAR
jgi:hypothetical protein